MSNSPRSTGRPKIGAVISAVVALLAVAALAVAFLNTASPYVTIAQARTTSGDSLHLAGELVPGTVSNDFARQTIGFKIKDSDGAVVHVTYDGPPPSNLNEATRIVAIGKLEGEEFRAHKLLVKCPSKYESEKRA
jgi:cytochrome c-type biogenesis protein CcmE